MANNIKELEDKLLAAEIHHDKGMDKSAYFTLRSAVLEFLGLSQEKLNEKVLEMENT